MAAAILRPLSIQPEGKPSRAVSCLALKYAVVGAMRAARAESSSGVMARQVFFERRGEGFAVGVGLGDGAEDRAAGGGGGVGEGADDLVMEALEVVVDVAGGAREAAELGDG